MRTTKRDLTIDTTFMKQDSSMMSKFYDSVQPSISVITVTYNDVNSLKETIFSVRMQDHKNIEHIIIDGGSSDGTVEYLKTIEDSSVRWISEDDGGIYDAMNKGLYLARGEYVHFLNAGDTFINPKTLAEVSVLLADKPNILMNRVRAIQGEHLQLYPKSRGSKTARDAFKSAYCHQAAFIKRTAYLDNKGFDTSYRHFADFKAIWSIRSKDSSFIETLLEVVNFPLNGVSSDGKHAYALVQERERLLAELGEPVSRMRYHGALVKARIYSYRAIIKNWKKDAYN